jgi:hypothetical protein
MTETTSIRLNNEDKRLAREKAAAYGLPSLAALVRFAIKQLKSPQRSTTAK